MNLLLLLGDLLLLLNDLLLLLGNDFYQRHHEWCALSSGDLRKLYLVHHKPKGSRPSPKFNRDGEVIWMIQLFSNLSVVAQKCAGHFGAPSWSARHCLMPFSARRAEARSAGVRWALIWRCPDLLRSYVLSSG